MSQSHNDPKSAPGAPMTMGGESAGGSAWKFFCKILGLERSTQVGDVPRVDSAGEEPGQKKVSRVEQAGSRGLRNDLSGELGSRS